MDLKCFACDKKIEGTGKAEMQIHLDGKTYFVFFHLHHYHDILTWRIIRMLERGEIDWPQFKRDCEWWEGR